MKPSESVAAFESFVESNGVSFIGITPSEGVVQMLDFYNAVPVEGCSGASGDMLLFQWGTFDWGGAETSNWTSLDSSSNLNSKMTTQSVNFTSHLRSLPIRSWLH